MTMRDEKALGGRGESSKRTHKSWKEGVIPKSQKIWEPSLIERDLNVSLSKSERRGTLNRGLRVLMAESLQGGKGGRRISFCFDVSEGKKSEERERV